MRKARNEKRKTTQNGRNRTTKSRKIRLLGEQETYKYLEILEADNIKQVQMKEKVKKEYLRRTRKLLETKLSSKNLIKEMKNRALALISYSGPFFKWNINREHKQIDQITRKLMTMHKALHPKTTLTDYMSQKKKRKITFPALKTALMHQYNDLKTI